jgi:hypothetical protein
MLVLWWWWFYRAARVVPSLAEEEGDGGEIAGATSRIALPYGEQIREGGLARLFTFRGCRVVELGSPSKGPTPSLI